MNFANALHVQMLVLGADDPLHHNYDYPVLSLPNGMAMVTNHILVMLAASVLMLLILPRAARAVATGKTGSSHDYVTKGTLSHMVEVVCVFFREQVARPVLGHRTDKFMPFIWTVFFFILFNNLLGMVPLLDLTNMALGPFFARGNGGGEHAAQVMHEGEGGAAAVDEHAVGDEHAAADEHAVAARHGEDEEHGEVGFPDLHTADAGEAHHGAGDDHHHHVMKIGPLVLFQDLTVKDGPASHFHGIGGTPTGNIAVTFALAFIALCVIRGWGFWGRGVGGFVGHLTLGTKFPLSLLMVVLEIIGLIAKPFALMVRLFANMTAGHAMLAALLGFASMAWNGLAVTTEGTSIPGAAGAIVIAIASTVFATAIGLLELLVAFIQAYIFTFLTTVFISMFQHHGEHGHEHEHGHDHHGHGHDEKRTPDYMELAATPQASLSAAPAH